MATPVLTASPDTPVGRARHLLKDAWIRHLPIVDGDLLVGIVSERDLRHVWREDVPVSDVMTRTVFVVSPQTPIPQAARLFRQRRFGALPVLEGRRLVGIVSIVDVLPT